MLEFDDKKRIVVTGIGTVNSLANNMPETWDRLIAGESGVELLTPLEKYDGFRTRIGGQVKDFNPLLHFSRDPSKRIHLSAQYSTIATIEALQQAGYFENGKIANLDPERLGIRIGTSVGGAPSIAGYQDILREEGEGRVPGLAPLVLLADMVSSVPSMELGAKGPVAITDAACATGNYSIVDAIYTLLAGDADVMITGSAEAGIAPISIAAFSSLGALSRRNNNPEGASRPFNWGEDKAERADGFVMSDGAGVLILESLTNAKNRKAKILAEIIGYGNTADAGNATKPSISTEKFLSGQERAMRGALNKANITPDDIDYISAHGTSTPTGDIVELGTIASVFHNSLDRLLVSSSKSQFGHPVGAGGGIEAAVSVMVLLTGIVPPTINLEDPVIKGIDLVPNIARNVGTDKIKTVMSNSFGFGGLNSCIIFKQYSDEPSSTYHDYSEIMFSAS